MRSDELEYCENCGSHSRFVPIFAAECSTRRCARCGGWSYAGKVTSEARELPRAPSWRALPVYVNLCDTQVVIVRRGL